MEYLRQGVNAIDGHVILPERIVLLTQKLGERNRFHINNLHIADRICLRRFNCIVLLFLQVDTKKASRSHDGKRRAFLVEILERIKRIATVLNFIKHKHVPLPVNLRPGDYLKLGQYLIRILRRLEDRCKIRHGNEIEDMNLVEVLAPEIFHEPGLPYLPSTHENERFAILSRFPAGKLNFYVSFHLLYAFHHIV